ncbi:MAG TPA: hypothetical protein VI796_01100, partial [Candidatus Thermoplasmatota archaeon]|nr:hypothetical protein [Candidatus Thermoplasmatota archaeon]
MDRAVEALREGDRLLRGAVTDIVERCVTLLQAEFAAVDREEGRTVQFELAALPQRLVADLENPFAQALAFN